ncbi:MAG: type I restriction enzyme HsdR N-terminal domain-containing protein [Tannerella sp.]|jgi:type I site-specific restriction endonuclease|nr:type I restriction enzyme HsdR N-terminal domain-containing protein [Tannerella sp.]
MQALNLPNYQKKLTHADGKTFIYDTVRRKKVVLTPEEWVRQHFVNYLITEKNYPKERIANEVTVSLNGMTRRCDTVVYNRYLEPVAIVEYKAPTVPISQDVFEQITRYNICLRVKILIVTNGLEHYCCRVNDDGLTYTYLKEVPEYGEIAET